ncbi:MAG TPA: class I SAM-dependent methyltransferase [Chloroflexi bacterium]|nr:class I SAM-dependent methyltransferase [Chloroflexota bacterium]
MKWLVVLLAAALAGLFLYWLLVITEGVYLGRRAVVWLYDLTADKYDGIKEFAPEMESFFVVRPLRHRLRHILAPLILDVATGTGRVPWFLLEDPLFNGRVIGLDASGKMLRLAAEKLKPYGRRAAFVQQTADRLPFADNTFHAVACLESLEFFPSDVAALQEMARVLQPGGVLLVTRRRGREAKLFPGRYRNVPQFEALLRDIGLVDVHTLPWQEDYDQVFGQKPAAGER